MKLKKLNLSAVEFFERVINGDRNPQCKSVGDSIVRIRSYNKDREHPFTDHAGAAWKYAIPVDE